jgi:4-hydroxybenzoate polyprenyltransferase
MNDVYDYYSDVKNPRKLTSGLEGAILYPVYHPSVRLAAYISTVFIFFTSLLTLQVKNVSAVGLLVFLGWQYSAPPLRLKEVPLLDSCSNGLIVFLAWLAGYTFGCGRLSNIPDKAFTLSLCTAGVHALGAAVDIESDTAAGQTTIATSLGQHSAAAFGASTL